MSLLREFKLFVDCSKLSIARHLQLNNRCYLHSSPAYWGKKKKFYNRYVKQMQNKNVYTGFVNEIFEKHKDELESLGNEDPEYNVEEEIHRESIRRHHASRYSRLMREVNKGAGPRLLTCDQMDHVRFLNQQSSDEWTVEVLAYSFQVPELVIRKVLRSRSVQNPKVKEKIDAKARENKGLQKQQLSPPVAQLKQTAGLSLVPAEHLQTQPSLGLPDIKNNGWFRDYNETKASSSNGDKVFRKKEDERRNDAGVEWMEEDDEEFMSYLLNSYEETEESECDEDPLQEEDGVEDSSEEKVEIGRDGKAFYLGEFLYKI